MRHIVQGVAGYLVEQQRRSSYELRQWLGIRPKLHLSDLLSFSAPRPAAGTALRMFSAPNTQLTFGFE